MSKQAPERLEIHALFYTSNLIQDSKKALKIEGIAS